MISLVSEENPIEESEKIKTESVVDNASLSIDQRSSEEINHSVNNSSICSPAGFVSSDVTPRSGILSPVQQTSTKSTTANKYVPHARYAATKQQSSTTSRANENLSSSTNTQVNHTSMNKQPEVASDVFQARSSVTPVFTHNETELINKLSPAAQIKPSEQTHPVKPLSNIGSKPQNIIPPPPPPPALPNPTVIYRDTNNNSIIPSHSSKSTTLPPYRPAAASKEASSPLNDRVNLMQEVRGHKFGNKFHSRDSPSKDPGTTKSNQSIQSRVSNVSPRKVFSKSFSTDNILTANNNFVDQLKAKLSVDKNTNHNATDNTDNNIFKLPTLNHVLVK